MKDLPPTSFSAIQIAVMNECTCGGGGPKDAHTCPACHVYHRLLSPQTLPQPLPTTPGTALSKAMHRANVARMESETDRFDPEDHLIRLADEVRRLHAVMRVISDYYGGCGYIGAMAASALRNEDR